MKYSKEFQLKLISEVTEQGFSVKGTSRRYGVHHRQLGIWLALYERYGSGGLDLRRWTYTGDFKLEVIRFMRDKRLTLLETAVEFGIPSISTVLKWERIYDKEGADGLYRDNRGRKHMKPANPKKPKHPLTVEEHLREENERLKAEVAYLKKMRVLVEERIARESGKKQKPSKD